jgi:hypothetical protein
MAMEAMKVANKQWEAAVGFLVNAFWTKSEILERQGKINDAIKTLQQVIEYFESKLGQEVRTR